MKRDLKLIRALLELMEQKDAHSPDVEVDGYHHQEINYHLRLCEDAEFVHVFRTATSSGSKPHVSTRLMWNGHEMLDRLRGEG